MSKLAGAIAATRFGMGARPGEIDAAASDPRGWLLAQLAPDVSSSLPDKDLISSRDAGLAFQKYRADRREARPARKGAAAEDAKPALSGDVEQAFKEAAGELREMYVRDISARVEFGVATPASFRERLVRFWSNHFSVGATKLTTIPYVGPFEREAIRPHVTGRFVDMLLAVETHPAMLLYLDNAQSVGPGSRAGRRRDRGLNENLAREALELHTLGVDGGYTQADVVELAKAITGWSIGNRMFGQDRPGQFVYSDLIHEPGARTVLGKRYAEGGFEQGRAILNDLARHPATARHISGKLARHFIADEPPAAAVEALARTFRDTDGDLKELARAVVALEPAWTSEQPKIKSTDEFVASALRALDLRRTPPLALLGAFRAMGQRPFGAPSPKGWPDEARAWAGPDALKKRLEWALQVGERLPNARPLAVLDGALGPLAGEAVKTAVARAASASQGLALALMSPEFQRR